MYGNGIVPLEVTGGILATTIFATGGLVWYHASQLDEFERQARSPEELSAAFQRTFARAISEGDEYTAAAWQRVRDPLQMALEHNSLSELGSVNEADLKMLQAVLDKDIPALRRLISPTYYGKEE
jgi:hypothetical protein